MIPCRRPIHNPDVDRVSLCRAIERGWCSQKQAAEIMGISPSNVYRYMQRRYDRGLNFDRRLETK